MTCPQCIGIEAQFNDKVARRELKRFLRSGPRNSTQLLLAQLREVGIAGRSLMDIGGGIGAIQHACAEDGAAAITSVDASPAFSATARSEAQKRGYLYRASYLEGNFVDLAPAIDAADLVTMDRVLCCYHDMPALLRPAAEKTRMCLGLVFPRESWWMGAGAGVVNFFLKIGGSKFRAFVHPHKEIEDCAAESGLSLRTSAYSGIWRVTVFERLKSSG